MRTHAELVLAHGALVLLSQRETCATCTHVHAYVCSRIHTSIRQCARMFSSFDIFLVKFQLQIGSNGFPLQTGLHIRIIPIPNVEKRDGVEDEKKKKRAKEWF